MYRRGILLPGFDLEKKMKVARLLKTRAGLAYKVGLLSGFDFSWRKCLGYVEVRRTASFTLNYKLILAQCRHP
jgi:hypothetical protein